MILAFGRYYTILNIKKDAEEPTHPYGRWDHCEVSDQNIQWLDALIDTSCA
jgi:hypothetical protein